MFLQIAQLLVVDDAKRLTIGGALNHEVFRAPRSPLSCCRSGTAGGCEGSTGSRRNSGPPRIVVEDASTPVASPPPAFEGRRIFRTAVQCVRFLVRLARIKKTSELLPIRLLLRDPYALKSVRRTTDRSTFNIYRWASVPSLSGATRFHVCPVVLFLATG